MKGATLQGAARELIQRNIKNRNGNVGETTLWLGDRLVVQLIG